MPKSEAKQTVGRRYGNGVGKGDGWGGPATGNERVEPNRAAPFQPGNTMGTRPRSMDHSERLHELREHLYRLAKTAEREETQLSATIALMNRLEGMPIARNINFNSEDPASLDDAALARIIAGKQGTE